MELAIDYNIFKTGKNFKGIRLDPGLHYFYFIDSGFFINIQQDLIVFDYKGNSFERETDVDQLERIRLNLNEFEHSLGYIQQENAKIWQDLVRYVLKENLSILPNEISPVGCTSVHSGTRDSNFIDFIPIDLKKSFPADISQRTKYSLDKSFLLDSILEKRSPEYLIGELALSFILFQVAQIFDGFEQWKILVSLFCHCSEAIIKHESLFLDFMELVQIHLQEFPLDFFQDELSSTSFLVEALHAFSLNCRDHPQLVKIQDRLDILLAFIDSRFSWNLSHNIQDIEDGEDAPVIVDV